MRKNRKGKCTAWGWCTARLWSRRRWAPLCRLSCCAACWWRTTCRRSGSRWIRRWSAACRCAICQTGAAGWWATLCRTGASSTTGTPSTGTRRLKSSPNAAWSMSAPNPPNSRFQFNEKNRENLDFDFMNFVPFQLKFEFISEIVWFTEKIKICGKN